MFSLSGNAPHNTDSDDMSASQSETKQTSLFDCKTCSESVVNADDYYGHHRLVHGIPEETAHRVDAESAEGPSPSVHLVSDESDEDVVVLNDAGVVEDIEVARTKKLQKRPRKMQKRPEKMPKRPQKMQNRPKTRPKRPQKMQNRPKTRRHRCRTCGPCRQPDCSFCTTCRKMEKFGGNGKRKQACERRKCVSIWPGLGGIGN